MLEGLLVVVIITMLVVGWIVIHKLNNLKKEQKTMSETVSEISGAADKIAADVDNIKRWQQKQTDDKAAMQEIIDGQKQLIADLQSRVAAGELDQAALTAAADKLEEADKALDAIEPDATPVPAPEPPAEQPAETPAETPSDSPSQG